MRVEKLGVAVALALLISAWAGHALSSAVAAEVEPEPSGERRAWMGVFLRDAVDGGIDLVAVVPGGPAERAGLQVGDVVVQVDDLRLANVADLTRILDDSEPGRSLQLQVIRSGATLRRVIELERRPASTQIVSMTLAAPPPAPTPPYAPRAGSRAYGLVLADVTPDLRAHYGAPPNAGVLVTGIDPGRRAAGDGFRVGDIVVRLGDRPVRQVGDVERVLSESRRDAIAAALIRGRKPTELTVRPVPLLEAGTVRDLPTAAPESDGEAAAELSLAREAHARALRMEIERLQKRIERLKRELESLDDEP